MVLQCAQHSFIMFWPFRASVLFSFQPVESKTKINDYLIVFPSLASVAPLDFLGFDWLIAGNRL